MIGRVTAVKAVGYNVLVEMLTANEIMNTKFALAENAVSGEAPQGYVLDIGPGVEVDKLGFKVGDRVLLQGNYVPVPAYGDSERKRGLVQPHDIKAVLEESNLVSL